MNFFTNFFHGSSLDLMILVVALCVDVLLSFVVLFARPRSATNRIFSLLTLSMVFWLVTTYIPRIPELYSYSLIFHRLGIFFAAAMSSLFFLLAHTMPHDGIQLRKSSFRAVYASTLFMMVLNLTPYAFISSTITGSESRPQLGWGFIPFAVLSTVFSVLTIYFLISRYRSSTGTERKQMGLMLFGIVLMLFFVITTIFIPLSFFDSLRFLPLAPLYTLIFLGMTAYAITKYQLLNIKVLLSQVLVLFLGLVLFAKMFGEGNLAGQFTDGLMLVVVSILGYFLVKSVRDEVNAREEIQGLAKKLTETNWQLARTNEQLRVIDQRKSEFVSIVSHQLRTPITAVKGYASLLLEEAYGALTDKQKPQVEKIFVSADRLAQMVNDFLDISKIEQGTMKYDFTKADITTMITEVFGEFISVADKKGLTLDLDIPDGPHFETLVDAGKLRQIFSNLLDNAIKYTPSGSVLITLSEDKEQHEILCKFKDSGVGLSQDDVHHLFGKFARGSQGQRQNTEGSGLGLYVAKKMLEAMGGRVWVDSEGIGKGSTFIIALPNEGNTQMKEQ